jgi:hypothetical protein
VDINILYETIGNAQKGGNEDALYCSDKFNAAFLAEE